ncbi:glycosyltransferase family 2 protein [Methanocaldococcus sp.]
MIVSVIPTYNEEKNIEKVLKELDEVKVDAIVVDDGSQDKTVDRIKSFSPKNIKIFLIENKKNLGKAKALEVGTKKAIELGYKYIVYIDGDYQFKPREIPKLFKKLKEENADAVFGIRRFKHIPFLRKITNFSASLLVSLAMLIYAKKLCYFRDIQCGFRIIKSEFLKDIYFGEGYAVEHIIALQLVKKRAKIVEEYVEVEYHDEAISYITTKKVIEVIKNILKFIFLGV